VSDEPPVEGDPAAHRSYEVYQRERVGESTALVKPRQLMSDEYLADPYPVLATLREHYPCYRDWLGNRFWITRYDDVTSVFVDDANFETRSKRWSYGRPGFGRDLRGELDVLWCHANRIDAGLDAAVGRCVDGLSDQPDLAVGFAARLPLELWGEVLGLAGDDLGRFATLYWRMQRGAGWDPGARHDGLAALDETTAWFDQLLIERRPGDGDDLISTAGRLEIDGEPVTGADLAATVLESDHETLHGGLANLWFRLLTVPAQLDVVRDDGRMVKSAWLETLRHSTPVLSALRFARQEVERFGRLIPAGALVVCSAAAANRDPRAFSDPDRFRVDRDDLCQREPRGQYRADGLPSGIAFGLGRPSIHPAVPRDRPRSWYAITRDVAVAASRALLRAYPDVALAEGAAPELRSLRLGEMHTCWNLPVRL
jgi:pulcherriminic acid synthase